MIEIKNLTFGYDRDVLFQQMDLSLDQAYELAGKVISASFAHEEGREGVDAFIEKRPPPGRK